MRFALTEEQEGFAASLSEMLARAGTPAVARAWAAGDHAPGRALWRRLADQGVCALVVPERDGGLGGSDVEGGYAQLAIEKAWRAEDTHSLGVWERAGMDTIKLRRNT